MPLSRAGDDGQDGYHGVISVTLQLSPRCQVSFRPGAVTVGQTLQSRPHLLWPLGIYCSSLENVGQGEWIGREIQVSFGQFPTPNNADKKRVIPSRTSILHGVHTISSSRLWIGSWSFIFPIILGKPSKIKTTIITICILLKVGLFFTFCGLKM